MNIIGKLPGIRGLLNLLQRRRAVKIILACGYFDHGYYLEKYPDVKKAGIPPLEHFLRYGAFEGRNPSAKFDSGFYLAANPDVRSAGINPLLHFIRYGIFEKRAPLPPAVLNENQGAVSIDPFADAQTIHIDYTINVVYPNSLQTRLFSPDGNKEWINTHFDEVYVINLNHGDDRSQDMEEQLRRLNIHARIVEGINGYELPHLYEYEQYAKLPPGSSGAPGEEILSKRKAISDPGAWGLLKTYRMILRDAMAHRHRRILVWEGNILCNREFPAYFRKLTESKGLTVSGIDESLFPDLLKGMEKMNLPADQVLRHINKCSL